MSHPAIAWVNKEAVDPPDLAIDGTDMVTGSYLCLPHRDNVFDYRPRMFGHGPTPMSWAAPPTGAYVVSLVPYSMLLPTKLLLSGS